MRKSVKLFAVFFLMAPMTFAQINNPGMHNERLNEILNGICLEVKGTTGYWEVNYKNRMLFVITDQANNRMRIITPIIEQKKLKKQQLVEAMEANFDKALDVKYALYKEVLWSVFAHPLKELTGDQVLDAVDQVFMAAATFGGSYTSTDLIFGGGSKE